MCYLILDCEQSSLIPFAEGWLASHPESHVAPLIIRSLLLANRSQTNISLATNWLNLNSADWYANVMLATLLSVQPTNKMIYEALVRIKQAKADEFEVILVIEPLVRADLESAKELAEWITSNSNHPLSDEILFECFRLLPNIFLDACIAWLSVNESDSDNQLIELLKRWILINPNHPDVEKIPIHLWKTKS